MFTPVGKYVQDGYNTNGYGMHDVTGNAEEWCLDYFSENAYYDLNTDNPYQGLPDQSLQGKTHEIPENVMVVRGGDFQYKYTKIDGDKVNEIQVGRRDYRYKTEYNNPSHNKTAGFRYVIPIQD